MHFSPKIRHIPLPCDTCDLKNGRKQVKKFGQPWLTLTVQFSYAVAIFACVSGQRTSCLSLSLSFFFIVPRWRLGRPGQAEKNEKASSLYRLRQSTIVEKMKRWKDTCLWDGMWPRSLRGWGWSLYFPSYARVHMKVKTFSFSSNPYVLWWARVSRVQTRKTRCGQF